MPELFNTEILPEKAILVGLITPKQDEEREKEYLDELAFLVETAGAIPGRRFVQRMELPDSRTYVGSGKLATIKEYINEHNIDIAVFDDELSPSQIRNIENELECKILDRNNLILDIFAKRAQTAYARTQVELAQLEYMLPRLTRLWTHLSKQRGGIGFRGPGEKEIETDRRVIRQRISLLKEKLKIIDKQMATQRGNREKRVRVALVGYTNVGKSTIMNLISKSSVFAENKLFATLDTTVRKVVIENLPFLLSDTVGFIRKLPVGLVESFKSTLDEVREADIILHVVDVSHSNFEEQINVVTKTLQELKASDKPTIMVFNKIDAYHFIERDPFDIAPATKENLSLDDLSKTWMSKENMPSIFISATKKHNIEALKSKIYAWVKEIHVKRYPYDNLLY
jgi:GTPase